MLARIYSRIAIGFEKIARKIISHKSLAVLIILIGLYVLVRSIYFPENLNFSAEQGAFAKKSFELWRDKKIELIGPAISFRSNGRMIFQGSITYYFQWLFLLPGRFDPVISSYLFMLFGAAMLIPLYFGVKNLGDEKKAIFVCSIYAFLPLYIDYSRFFWNPNYQFVLTPLVIWFTSIYVKDRKRLWLFFESLLLGILLLFHYQYFVVIGMFLMFHLTDKKFGLKEIAIFTVGIILGFFPMILFELRHNFYNIRTLLMFLEEKNNVFLQGGGFDKNHYYLSISLCALVFFISIKNIKLNWIFVGVLGLFLFALSLFKVSSKPTHGFGMSANWNYPLELKANEIIRSSKIRDYNVANLIYNTKASVQKYLLKIHNVNIDEENYTTNTYLFIITDRAEPLSDPAYEVNWFKPSTLIQDWNLNDQYFLYLFKRN